MGYESRNIPLDTLVMDMDWHKTFYKEAAEGVVDQVSTASGCRLTHVICHVIGWGVYWVDWLHLGQASFP